MNFMEKRSIRVLMILASVLLVFGLVQTSFAQLTISRNTDLTVRVDPVDGFPLFYQDTGGVALTLCLDQVPRNICILPPAFLVGNPPPPITFPGNFPPESFYYFAQSIMDVGGTPAAPADRAVIRFILEGAFAAGPVVDGQQQTFLRINLNLLRGLTPNSTYTVTHPYGTFNFSTDAAGDALRGLAGQTFRVQEGCVGVPCNFARLLPATATGIDTFLQWAPPAIPPAGFIGHGAFARRVIGGPNGNVFRITGPNIGGPGINTKQTALFVVAGKIFAGFSITGSVRNPDGTRAAGVTVTLSGDATGTATTNANGVFVFRNLANGSYTVTPSMAGFAFLPASRAVTINGANVTGAIFTRNAVGAFSISGFVRNAAGVGVGGVTMRLSGPAAAATTTAANGLYRFLNLANGTYTVTPSQTGGVVTLTRPLSGAQEVPPVTTTASGTGTLTVNLATGAISGTVTFTGLSSNATASHIHQAAAGVNGPIIVPLAGGAGVTAGTWTIPAGSVLTAPQLTALRANGLYFNVHSLTNPGGEIRGQINFVTFTPVQRSATINGADVTLLPFRRN